jgi:hypothetical protein
MAWPMTHRGFAAVSPWPDYWTIHRVSVGDYGESQLCIITHRIHVWYICANIGGILMVNVTIYSIHGSYGYYRKILDTSKSRTQSIVIGTKKIFEFDQPEKNIQGVWDWPVLHSVRWLGSLAASNNKLTSEKWCCSAGCPHVFRTKQT